RCVTPSHRPADPRRKIRETPDISTALSLLGSVSRGWPRHESCRQHERVGATRVTERARKTNDTTQTATGGQPGGSDPDGSHAESGPPHAESRQPDAESG